MYTLTTFIFILALSNTVLSSPYDDGKYRPVKYKMYDDGKYYRPLDEGKYIPGDEGRYNYVYLQGLYPGDEGDYRYVHQVGPDDNGDYRYVHQVGPNGGNGGFGGSGGFGGNGGFGGKGGKGPGGPRGPLGPNRVDSNQYIEKRIYAERFPYIHSVINGLVNEFVSYDALRPDASSNDYRKVFAQKAIAVKCHYLGPAQKEHFVTEYPPQMSIKKEESPSSFYSFKGSKNLTSSTNNSKKLKLDYEVLVKVYEYECDSENNQNNVN